MTTSSNTQVVVRFWDSQFFEKYIRHIGMIMLASMDNYFANIFNI